MFGRSYDLAWLVFLCYLFFCMKLEAVFFDLGETLLNYGRIAIGPVFAEGAHLTYGYLRVIAVAAGASGDLWGFRRYHFCHSVSIRWHYFLSSLTRREFDCRSLLAAKAGAMGISLSAEQLDHLSSLWYKPLGDLAAIEPDLHESLRILRDDMGLRLAIISNTFLPAFVLDRHLDVFGLLEFFPIRQYSSDTVFRKPHPYIYKSTLSKMGVSPGSAVMVGDKWPEDIAGARRVGIAGIFKRGAANGRKRIPSSCPAITRISELPDLLRIGNYANRLVGLPQKRL